MILETVRSVLTASRYDRNTPSLRIVESELE